MASVEVAKLPLRLRQATVIAFSSAKHARHLRGCYLTRDSVYSESALLRRHFSAVPSA